MYNLLVSNLVPGLGEHEPVEIDRQRFLEYTSQAITEQLASLSVEAILAMESWPCLVMAEGRAEERAFLAQPRSAEVRRSQIALTIERVPVEPYILNAAIWKLRGALEIEQFEFTRNHWAVKAPDLLSILAEAGFGFDPSTPSRFSNRPLPAPARAALLAAGKSMGEWGHTEIDDFLLEAGVPDLQAGREIGSRRDRANAILRFVLEHPGATTAENSLLSVFLPRYVRAKQGEPEPSEAPVSPTRDRPRPATLRDHAAGIPAHPNRVFVVHGSNESARDQVVNFLTERGLKPIVLHEQPNMGRHLLTKFIDEAELATFAVVLMTDDDVGGRSVAELTPRARQNVILELGYFLAHLGQPRVCALKTPGLETPSDFDGIVYIGMADDGRWRVELERELRAAGMPLQAPMINA